MGGPGSGRKKGSGGGKTNPKTGLPGVSKQIKRATSKKAEEFAKNYSSALKMHKAIQKAK
jgi:hypothetical protein